MNKGYIKLHRKLKDHWIFQKAEYLKAWIDMLLTVNYKEEKILIRGTIYTCKRGQSLLSIKSWATRWKWHYLRVRRFFQMLSKDQMIDIDNETVTTRITILNYDSYQELGNIIEIKPKSNRKANEKQMKTTKRNINKYKNNIYTSDFEKFWEMYPRKIGKSEAFKKFEKIDIEINTILKSLEEQKKQDQWSDVKFIPHPSTWLNQRRWEDEVQSVKGMTDQEYDDHKRKMRHREAIRKQFPGVFK